MNLPNNIKKLRKDNNLSQEQLAEQLGVSRQAISKWESGQSYPEMDKVLLICKIFGCGIDELMHEDIREVSETKQTKANINKYIDDFFDFITRFVGMLGAMTFKDKIKFLFEQVMIGGILFIISLLIYYLLDFLFMNGLSMILDYNNLYHVIKYVFDTLCVAVFTIISIPVMLHTMKIRYLNYYEMEKTDTEDEEEPEPIEEESYETESDTQETIDIQSTDTPKKKRRLFAPRHREKIIIRDPKHSHSGFLIGIMKVLISVFKAISVLLGIFLCVSFIAMIAALVFSFMFIGSGLTFVGVFFALISMLMITFVLLSIIYNFLASKKNRKTLISILLIVSLAFAGIGTGLFAVGITGFDVVPYSETKETTYTVDMKENLCIENWYCPTYYVVKDTDKVEIVLEHSAITEIGFHSEGNCISYYAHDSYDNIMKIIRQFISDINNKKLCLDFDSPVSCVTVYADEENIEILKNNSGYLYDDTYEEVTQTTIHF